MISPIMPRSMPVQQTDLGCQIAQAKRWEVRYETAVAGVQAYRSRSLPWLHVTRVLRFGRDMLADDVNGLVYAMRQVAEERPVLRLHIETLSEKAEEREVVARACEAAGFRKNASARSYAHTVWIDLGKSEDEIFAGFGKGCRQNIRAPAKKGYVVRQIVDPEAAPTLQTILVSTFRRTGGTPPVLPWQSLIRAGTLATANLHLVGLFKENDYSGRAPVSFALAYLHGDVAEYAHAGSVRDESVGHFSLLNAPVWDLMRWARGRGARWWDFGGVVPKGESARLGKLAGINSFKRSFSDNIVEVGDEWVLEPRKRAALVSETVGRLKASALASVLS